MVKGTIHISPLGRGLYSIKSIGYYSKALTEACGVVPGMRYTSETGWYGYGDALECLREELKKRGVKTEGALEEPDSWRNFQLTHVVARKGDDGNTLRGYQNDGVLFCIARMEEGCLLADGMRLGKSRQATVAARYYGEKTLVVCPPAVVGVWSRPPNHPKPGEFSKAWRDVWKGVDGKASPTEDGGGLVVLEGVAPAKWQKVFRDISEIKEEKRTPKHVADLTEANAKLEGFLAPLTNALAVVVHDAIVYAWVDVLLRWGVRTLIRDESHADSTWDSRRAIAVREIAAETPRRVFLSGTPMLNRPRDLHNVVDILCPGRFGVFFRPANPEKANYAMSFCGSHQKTVGMGPESKTVWDHSGKSNEELLHRRVSYFMLRRVAKEVDDQLPELQRQIVDVRIPPTKCVMPTFDVLKDRQRLRRVLDLAADGKFRSVVDLVKAHVEEGEKILVFCHRKRFAEAVVNELRGFAGCGASYVHGDLPDRVREQRMIEAEKAPGAYVFAATIESCSTGIDLSFASVTVFAELVWEPMELAQAEARTYAVATGGKRLIQYVIAKGTGDELILRTVISKLNDFEKIIGETGDNMRIDLGKKERPEDALKRLADALMSMHGPKGPPVKRGRKADVGVRDEEAT